jgi:hypothetical protein
MSTLTFKGSGRAALAAACLSIAGCDGGLFGASLSDAPTAPTHATVTSDRIIVTGPPGYCVDPTATMNQDSTGFVLLGNCAAIANSRRARQPDTPAILTATISEPFAQGRLSDVLDQLDTFFRTPEGLALISRSGDPAAVKVLETAAADDVFLLHASDQSDSTIAGVQPEYWRAYLDVGPRIATLSVLALQDRSLSRDESLATLKNFVQSMQQANMAPEVSAAPPTPALPEVQAAPQNGVRNPSFLWNLGIFRQIFE